MLKCNPTKKTKDLLRNKSTNILTIIHSNLYFPTYSNSLKDIGKYLGSTWSNADLIGIQTLVWRKRWEKTNDVELREALIKYNYEDCVALKILTNFVYEVFNREDGKNHDSKVKNIALAGEIKSADEKHQLPLFGNLKSASEDIAVINKCAYFEYQRNRIFFRSNRTGIKINKRKKKQTKFRYKANKIINIKSYKCPYCKSKNIIHDNSNFYSRICFDLHFLSYGIKRWITIYRIPFHSCSSCKKKFLPKKFKQLRLYARRSKIPKKYKEQKGYGHNILAWVIHQNIVNRTTFRDIENAAKEYFGLPMRTYWLKKSAADYYKVTYNKILKKMIQGPLIHADETKVGLRNNIGYIWVLATMEEVLYLYKPTREANFLHELLEGFKGVLVSDFYAGYDSLECQQQKCLIHLIRDLNDDLLKNPFDEELKELVTKFGHLLRAIIGTIDRVGLKSRYMKKHKKEVKRFYRWISKQNFSSEHAENYKKRMLKYEKELFLFLDYDNIPWNNNNAEYAIKHFANFRKNIEGLTTEKGLEVHLILLSIYQTCNYKGINFLDFLLSKERDIDKFNMKH